MLTLRRATLDDAERLLSWRNDPITRESCPNSRIIGRDEHYKWLTSVLYDPMRALLIAERGGVPVGTVRLDQTDFTTEMSWTVAHAFRSLGVGQAMVCLAVENVPQNISASVRSSNTASAKIAERAGFQLLFTYQGVHFFMRPRSRQQAAA